MLICVLKFKKNAFSMFTTLCASNGCCYRFNTPINQAFRPLNTADVHGPKQLRDTRSPLQIECKAKHECVSPLLFVGHFIFSIADLASACSSLSLRSAMISCNAGNVR